MRNFSFSIVVLAISLLSSAPVRADDWGMIIGAWYEAARQRSDLKVDEEKVSELNNWFESTFKRNPVIATEDKETLLSPTADIWSLFDKDNDKKTIKEDIDGNNGNTFKVKYRGKDLVVESLPRWVFHSDNEQYDYELKAAIAEIEGSYKLEDIFDGRHIRKVHHIVAKIEKHWRTHENLVRFYAIKEYVPGDDVLDFDYGVTFRGHADGKKIELAAARTFMIELFTLMKTLVKNGIFPSNMDDRNIIIRYSSNSIDWRLINYHHLFTREKELNVDDIRMLVMHLSSMLTWRMCEYTGYTTHHLAAAHRKHTLWTQLHDFFEQKQAEYRGRMKGSTSKGWPKATLEEVMPFLNEALTILKTSQE